MFDKCMLRLGPTQDFFMEMFKLCVCVSKVLCRFLLTDWMEGCWCEMIFLVELQWICFFLNSNWECERFFTKIYAVIMNINWTWLEYIQNKTNTVGLHIFSTLHWKKVTIIWCQKRWFVWVDVRCLCRCVWIAHWVGVSAFGCHCMYDNACRNVMWMDAKQRLLLCMSVNVVLCASICLVRMPATWIGNRLDSVTVLWDILGMELRHMHFLTDKDLSEIWLIAC